MIQFDYLYDYYPKSITDVTEVQMISREKVQDFMFGEADFEILHEVIARVKKVVETKGIDVVCFAPGSTYAKTILRFGRLAEILDEELNCDVYLDAVTLKFDADPITHERYYQCKKERVNGKSILLLGGVYITGQALQEVGDLLLGNGAKSVYGLFIAKTHYGDCN